MPLQLHPSVTATDTEDAVLVSLSCLFLTSRDSSVLTPIKGMVLWKAADTRELLWSETQNRPFWCIFSHSIWKAASKTSGSAHESSRWKRCYSPCSLSLDESPFALFMKAFVQPHWCRCQVLLEGLLAQRLWPGGYCPNLNGTGHREQVRILEQLLWVTCFAHPGLLHAPPIFTAFALVQNHLQYLIA